MKRETPSSDDQKNYWDTVWTEEAAPLAAGQPITQWTFYDTIKYRLMKKLLPPAGARVLEVGSGSANISFFMANDGYKITVLDFSEQALALVQHRFAEAGRAVTPVRGDAEKLPFDDHSFDLVMSYGLLEHFRDPRLAINEMVRVLKPGGIFIGEIITKRISIRTLGQLISVACRVPYHLFFRLDPRKALWDFSNVFAPGFYENTLGRKEYASFIAAAGARPVTTYGYMPFPPIYLPDFIVKHYIAFLKKMSAVYSLFFSTSAFSLAWCSSWIMIARKTDNEREQPAATTP